MSNSSPHSSTLAISPLVGNRAVDVSRGNVSQPFFPSPLAAAGPESQKGKQSPIGEFSDSQQLEPALSPAEKLRLWRHDALMQHHYATAEFVGDKVLALTNDPNDAFWLAQVYYSNGDYYRARKLLQSRDLEMTSVTCRYLSALCLIKLELWDEALDIVGEVNPFAQSYTSTSGNGKNLDGGIKLEASLCYLRGQIYANQNNLERAKDCYKEAILVDVKCFEAFNELVRNTMLTPEEEWELLSLLDFEDLDENSELIKSLYSIRINKYINKDKSELSENILTDEFNMSLNADLLASKANLLFIQCKFQKCIEICEIILKNDEFNFHILPLYLTCLHELNSKNKLFLIAHKLSEFYPKNSITYLSIGIYYLSINKISEARKFFSRSSILDPNFGQAWIGFAHTFAAEGEHEQAISAYSTASRFFPGTHLPNLFLGMQYLQMNNLILAEEYLLSSFEICSLDPLLLNELGVIYYHKNDLSIAENYFLQALNASKLLDSDSKAWISIHSNLGHVYRRMNFFNKALNCFKKVLKISNNDHNIFSAIGLIYLKMNDLSKSIENLHYALSSSPNDPVATDLLKRALEENLLLNNDLVSVSLPSTSSSSHNINNSSGSSSNTNNLFNFEHKRSILATPLNNKQKSVNINTMNSSIDQIATDLINGDDSSDEGEIMDMSE